LSELRTAATGGLENVMASGRTTLETATTNLTERVPLTQNEIEARLPEYGESMEMTDFAAAARPALMGDAASAGRGFSFTGGALEPNYNMYSLAPARVLPTEGLQSLQSEGGAALTNILGVPEQIGGRIAGAGQEVATTLASTAASTAAKGGAVVSDLASAGTGAVTKAASTLQEAGGAAADIVKGAAGDVAETALEASSAFLPVIGEVTAVALGGYQLYEGFKDLFSHPSAAAPVTVAMPTVANIGQGFQSGI
jgi:hypothetical protein